MSILHWQLAGAPLAVVDIETTGLNPGFDRAIEVSVVHLDRGEPELVLDSLIFPERAIDQTGIHGLSYEDLVNAPRFLEIAYPLMEAIAGRVVVAHNADFDLRFLATELGRLGVVFTPPYLCTMALSSVLRAAPDKKRLGAICGELGIPLEPHRSSEDAIATGRLTLYLRALCARQGLRNFSDLQPILRSACAESWGRAPLLAAPALMVQEARAPLSRPGVEIAPRRVDYCAALFEVLADLEVTDEERDYLRSLQSELRLTKEKIRAAHAAVLTWYLSSGAADGWIDDVEAEHLEQVYELLGELGWAPGFSRASVNVDETLVASQVPQ